jgi:nucleotide-binding universal stress UspA family protein
VFRSIVVACDESEQSLRAIEMAEQLRDPDGGRLILVSVFPFFRGFAAPALPFLYAQWLRDQADQILDLAAKHVTPGVPYETQSIASPSTASGLNDTAESANADLLVLGPSHHKEFGRWTGRATVQRLLHGAPCAIAVAAPDQATRPARATKITVAYDGSDESVHARDTAFELAAGLGLGVQLCAAIEPLILAVGFADSQPDPNQHQAREEAAKAGLAEAAAAAPPGVNVEISVSDGPPAETVLRLAGDDVALIVTGSRGYGTLHRAIAGAVSGALLLNGRVPVLVTPRVSG